MFGVLGLLARLVDDGPVGRHVVFPRNSYPRAFRTECPFVAFLHLTRGLEPDNCTAQVSVDHRVKTYNKPHSIELGTTSDCSKTVDFPEVFDDGLRCKVRGKPVDQFLFGFLEDGWCSRQRTRHGEARSGPRHMAVRSMGTVRSQWLPQTCWLELRACDKTGTMFPHSDFQKLDCYVRDFLHLDFVVFASVLHAPDKMFGERPVLRNNDDVVLEPSVQVN